MFRKAVLINSKDNVATAVLDLKKGEKIYIDMGFKEAEVILNHDIPFGHKLAVKEIGKNSDVIKYGECIGAAIDDIRAGDYVHVHNVESKRARGDREVQK